MLERWEEMRLYDRIREAQKGSRSTCCTTGRPTPTGRIHLGTALNKTLKDFVVKCRSMSGFDAPYVPGWDCHGLPIEIKVDDELGRKKLEMDPLAGARCVPQLRREVPRPAARAIQAPRRVRPLGRAVLDHGPAVRERRDGDLLRVLRAGPGLQGPEVGVLVHPRQDRAGRGGSRVRDAHQPQRLGAVSADQRSGEDRSGAGRQEERRHHHLDDHSVDAAGLDGGDVRARRGVRRAGYWRVDLHRCQGTGAADHREVQSRRCQGDREFPRLEAGVRDLRASLPRAQRSGRAWRLRHHGHRHRRGAHRSGAWRGRLPDRREVRHRPALRRGRRRHPAQRPAGVRGASRYSRRIR